MISDPRIRTVIAVFTDKQAAHDSYLALQQGEFDDHQLSLLSGQGDGGYESADDLGVELAKGAGKGSALGGVAGGALGALGGLLAFAIPGVGPGIGAGVWAATVGAAAAGATMGGMIGAFQKMWDERYQEAVAKGAVLVGVTVDSPAEAAQAVKLLTALGPDSVDELDDGGELVHRH